MKKLSFAILITVLIIPGVSLASIDANLKYGARGAEVIELQEFLIDQGFLTGQATGNFFSLTRKAVVTYQTSVGLPATGFVGPLTRSKINDVLLLADISSNTAEVAETGATTTPIKNDTTTALQKQIDTLLAQLQQLNTQIQAQVKVNKNLNLTTVPREIATTTKTIIFPNGDIAEVNERGDIIRYIKISTAQQTTQPNIEPTEKTTVQEPQKEFVHASIKTVPLSGTRLVTPEITTFRFTISNSSSQIITITGAQLEISPEAGAKISSNTKIDSVGNTRYLEKTLLSDLPSSVALGLNVPFTSNPFTILPYSSLTFDFNVYNLVGSFGPSTSVTLKLLDLHSPNVGVKFESLPLEAKLTGY